MNKQVKIATCVLVLSSMLCACNAKKDMKETENKVEQKTNTAKNNVEDNIDNFMNYFKTKGVVYKNDANIDKMDFAAYEGRSFDYNGTKAYLYRVKSDDENMKKVLKEANDKGKVKVKVDNKEQEYGAKVNGDYLLLYDTKADMKDVLTAFPGYVPGTTTTSSSEEFANPNTNNQEE